MKLKLGIYYKPDTLEMIEVTDIDSYFVFGIAAWILVNDDYYHCAFSAYTIRNNYKYLGEL